MEVIILILANILVHLFFLIKGNMNHIKHTTIIYMLVYGVPQCFQKPTFKLDDAIKIINCKQQTQKNKKKI